MESAVKISNKTSVKSSIKFLLIFLPMLGLLVGVGIGLIVGNLKLSTPLQLYGQIATILLPSLAIMIFGLSSFFKKINSI